MNAASMYGLFAQGVIVAAAVCAVALRHRGPCPRPMRQVMVLALSVLAVLLVPMDGVSIACHLRGLWGDPSVVTLGVLLLHVLRPSALPAWPDHRLCALLTVLVTLPLYAPLFLSVPMVTWDLYTLGLQPWVLLAALAITAVLLRRRAGGPWTALVGVALLAWAAGLMESDNLWDYLADPVLLLAMAFAGFTGIWTSLHR